MGVRLVAPPHVDVIWHALMTRDPDAREQWVSLDQFQPWFLDDYAARLDAKQATQFIPGTTFTHPQAKTVTRWRPASFMRAVVDAVHFQLVEFETREDEEVFVRPVPPARHTASRLCDDRLYEEFK